MYSKYQVIYYFTIGDNIVFINMYYFEGNKKWLILPSLNNNKFIGYLKYLKILN